MWQLKYTIVPGNLAQIASGCRRCMGAIMIVTKTSKTTKNGKPPISSAKWKFVVLGIKKSSTNAAFQTKLASQSNEAWHSSINTGPNILNFSCEISLVSNNKLHIRELTGNLQHSKMSLIMMISWWRSDEPVAVVLKVGGVFGEIQAQICDGNGLVLKENLGIVFGHDTSKSSSKIRIKPILCMNHTRSDFKLTRASQRNYGWRSSWPNEQKN